jgi:RsiW-degrading membrane proteinase PrsW (M82 family)
VKLVEIILLFVFSFLPPIIYAVWIRNTERLNREKWWPIIFCFLWGATIAIIASIILEMILGVSLAENLKDLSYLGISSAVVIAPFAEELVKPLALGSKTVKKELTELEDGLIYGAVAGLGFSATENLFYIYKKFRRMSSSRICHFFNRLWLWKGNNQKQICN